MRITLFIQNKYLNYALSRRQEAHQKEIEEMKQRQDMLRAQIEGVSYLSA